MNCTVSFTKTTQGLWKSDIASWILTGDGLAVVLTSCHRGITILLNFIVEKSRCVLLVVARFQPQMKLFLLGSLIVFDLLHSAAVE
jgi:hypothetical protein